MRGIGDNAGPPRTLAERLAEENRDLLVRAADIESGIDKLLAGYVNMTDGDFDSKAADFIGRNGVVSALLKLAETRRTMQVEPHLTAQRQINAHYDAMLREIKTPDDGESKAKTLRALVLLVKERRGGKAIAHGQSGTSSVRTTYKFKERESDLMALAKAVVAGEAPLEYLDFHRVNIGVAIRSKHIYDIPGCKIDEIRSV